MRRITTLALAATFVACTTTSTDSAPAAAVQNPAQQEPNNPAAPAKREVAEAEKPSILKLDPSEVPTAVRAIEAQIDKKHAVLADEIVIEVSCNYEWDVALTGDDVSKLTPDRGGQRCEATGAPRAIFRNLDLRARKRIVLWKSGLDVTPFIRIVAKGQVSHIDSDATGAYRVARAELLRIDNANLTSKGEAIPVGSKEP